MKASRSFLVRFLIGTFLVTWFAACSAPPNPAYTPGQADTVVQTQAIEASEAAKEIEATEAPDATAAPAEILPTSVLPAEAAETASDFPYASTTAPATRTPSPTQTLDENANQDGASLVPTLTPRVEMQQQERTILEPRLVELEYPETLRLGDSDIIRLTLLPLPEGYLLQSEFPDHTTVTQTVQVQHPDGYDVVAIARLDAVNFTFSPSAEQEQNLLPGETLAWFWSLTPNSAGQQRLSITLALRWQPRPGVAGNTRQVVAYAHSVEVGVISFLGLTRHQAALGGLASLAAGGGLGLMALAGGRWRARKVLQAVAPNPILVIEPRPGLSLLAHERQLLSALFQKYARLAIESEFLSGYSGARTFLAIPIHPDGRADAATIVKLGEAASIEREYHNYENFVKDSLPPVTARIQRPPVTLSSPLGRAAGGGANRRAALQYTFIGAPGQSPQSLRLALLENPDPALLRKLFETFGPNWWMQRHPYTFRLSLEYDRLLPSHFVIEPASGRGKVLDGAGGLATLGDLQEGDRVTLRGFRHAERRADGRLSLRGDARPGVPPLRIRWLGDENPNGAVGRIVATRQTLLQEFTAGMDLLGLPDPLERLPWWLNETVHGSQSTIHGDLNLENILTGPGGFVWLIDFAQTREGHPLADFAHLEAEIIAHVIAPHLVEPVEYLAFLKQPTSVLSAESQAKSKAAYYALRNVVAEIAAHCLLNPSQPREYELARLMACLGALKYGNLDRHAKHLLYLTAAHVASRL